MRVALIHPASPFLLDAGVHPPLGLWYLGASLKDAGHEVVYVDRGLGDPLPRDCDVWALTGTTPQLPDMAQVLSDAGDTPVIVGGPHATLDPDGMLALGAATVIRGEGEYALTNVLWGRARDSATSDECLGSINLDDYSWVIGNTDYIYGKPIQFDGGSCIAPVTNLAETQSGIRKVCVF